MSDRHVPAAQPEQGLVHFDPCQPAPLVRRGLAELRTPPPTEMVRFRAKSFALRADTMVIAPKYRAIPDGTAYLFEYDLTGAFRRTQHLDLPPLQDRFKVFRPRDKWPEFEEAQDPAWGLNWKPVVRSPEILQAFPDRTYLFEKDETKARFHAEWECVHCYYGERHAHTWLWGKCAVSDVFAPSAHTVIRVELDDLLPGVQEVTRSHLWTATFTGRDAAQTQAVDMDGQVTTVAEYHHYLPMRFASSGDLLWLAAAPVRPLHSEVGWRTLQVLSLTRGVLAACQVHEDDIFDVDIGGLLNFREDDLVPEFYADEGGCTMIRNVLAESDASDTLAYKRYFRERGAVPEGDRYVRSVGIVVAHYRYDDHDRAIRRQWVAFCEGDELWKLNRARHGIIYINQSLGKPRKLKITALDPLRCRAMPSIELTAPRPPDAQVVFLND